MDNLKYENCNKWGSRIELEKQKNKICYLKVLKEKNIESGERESKKVI